MAGGRRRGRRRVRSLPAVTSLFLSSPFLGSAPLPCPSPSPPSHTHAPWGPAAARGGSTRGPGFVGLEPGSRGIRALVGVLQLQAAPEAPGRAADRSPDVRSPGGTLKIKAWASWGRCGGERVRGSRRGDEAEPGHRNWEQGPALPICWSPCRHLSLVAAVDGSEGHLRTQGAGRVGGCRGKGRAPRPAPAVPLPPPAPAPRPTLCLLRARDDAPTLSC